MSSTWQEQRFHPYLYLGESEHRPLKDHVLLSIEREILYTSPHFRYRASAELLLQGCDEVWKGFANHFR